ncbi:MAG: NUDIX domain-containing protein [Patescibacteria group bacterium]
MKQLEHALKQNLTFVPAVVGFPIKGNKVLLMHRIKTSSGLGQDLVSGIGGKVGDEEMFKGESHEEALVRETKEEVGIVPIEFKESGNVTFIWTTKPEWNMKVKIYTINSWEGVPKQTEVALPVWHNKNNLPKENMWEDNIHWVPKVLAGEIVDAVFLYDESKRLSEYLFK